jgi:hypothetical protein
LGRCIENHGLPGTLTISIIRRKGMAENKPEKLELTFSNGGRLTATLWWGGQARVDGPGAVPVRLLD